MEPPEKQPNTKDNANRVCPVCETTRQKGLEHCETCAWYFPMADSPQYFLELNRAKQQHQMMTTFNELFDHIEAQNKKMKKMSLDLTVLEKQLKQLQAEKDK